MFEITIFDSKKGFKGKIGLSISLSALVFLIVSIFPSLSQSGFNLGEYIENLPPAFAKAFGATLADYNTIEGFLGIEFYSFFWVVVLGGYFAYKGGGLVSGEIENKRIDLILATPIKRTKFLIEKLLGFIPDMFLINLFVVSSVLGSTYLINESINLFNLTKIHLLSFPFWFACGSIGVLISVLINEEKRSQLYAAGIIFGTYLVETVTLDTDFEFLANFSFTHYYKPVSVLNGGKININNLLIMVIATISIVLLSLYLFNIKDIRT